MLSSDLWPGVPSDVVPLGFCIKTLVIIDIFHLFFSISILNIVTKASSTYGRMAASEGMAVNICSTQEQNSIF
jgi:hypothetical protein